MHMEYGKGCMLFRCHDRLMIYNHRSVYTNDIMPCGHGMFTGFCYKLYMICHRQPDAWYPILARKMTFPGIHLRASVHRRSR